MVEWPSEGRVGARASSMTSDQKMQMMHRDVGKGIVLRGVGGSLVIVIYDRIKTKRGGYG